MFLPSRARAVRVGMLGDRDREQRRDVAAELHGADPDGDAFADENPDGDDDPRDADCNADSDADWNDDCNADEYRHTALKRAGAGPPSSATWRMEKSDMSLLDSIRNLFNRPAPASSGSRMMDHRVPQREIAAKVLPGGGFDEAAISSSANVSGGTGTRPTTFVVSPGFEGTFPKE